MLARKTRRLCLLALAGACGLLGGQAASRQVPQSPAGATTLGILVCSVMAASDARAAAAGRDVLCRFQPGRRGSEETYAGTVQAVGETEALFRKGAVILEVRAPASTNVLPGILQQIYSTEASPAGAAARLIGEANRAIMLQPLAEEEGRVAAGKTRPDAVIIILELQLRSSPA